MRFLSIVVVALAVLSAQAGKRKRWRPKAPEHVKIFDTECNQDRFDNWMAKEHIDRLLCWDSDPVPAFIFEPTLENVFMQSGALPMRDYGDFQLPGIVTVDLGAGYFVISETTFQFAIIAYEDCLVATTPCPSDQIFRGMIIIDFPVGTFAADGIAKIGEIAQTYGLVPTDAIVSHFHFDHIGFLGPLLGAFPSITNIIAAEATKELIEELIHLEYDNERVMEILGGSLRTGTVPNIVFAEEYVLTRGNQTLHLRDPPINGHSNGNILVYHNASKSLWHDDIVFAKWSPIFNLGAAENVAGYLKIFDYYREYDYTHLMAGHATHLAVPQDVDDTEEYVIDILDAAWRAYQSALVFPSELHILNIAVNLAGNAIPGTPNFGNGWIPIQYYYRRIAMECAKIVDDPTENLSGKLWSEVLAGHKIMVYSHCFTTMFSFRVETPGLFQQ